jgi:ppGpp synthetase/RelA/SpoT-type nucleotidyltranferase
METVEFVYLSRTVVPGAILSLIDEFLDHYSREFDYYAQVARTIQQKLEAALASRGIRAMVTSRAKRPDRLRDKLANRDKEKKYKSLKAIYKDIIDLSGVRIALYFPGDRDRIATLITELFEGVRAPKDFPESKKPKVGKRFIGYVATHYLVHLKIESPQDAENRYSSTVVEIQVASVLMHAWAEVEHDLIYKRETGDPSPDESAILDEINGLVLTGEIALERLQKAIQRRTAKDDILFKNYFELASYLAQRAPKLQMQTADIGRVNVLFEVLQYLRLDTPKKLCRYMNQIDSDDKSRPIADVVLDKLLAGQPKSKVRNLSSLISKILSRTPFGSSGRGDAQAAIGFFLTQWIELETTIRHLTPSEGRFRSLPVVHAIHKLQLPPQLRDEVARTNRLRNELVHGIERPNASALYEAGNTIRDSILPEIKKLERIG